MATFGVRHSSRTLKNGRLRGRHESEENVRLDFSKVPSENVKEILTNVVSQNGITKNKKLAYLNLFVKLINKVGSHRNLGFTVDEILCCLKVGLLHEAKEVRAATLRVIRYLLTEQKVLDTIVNLHIDYLIARCLDICLSNEVERIHAMKLIRKMIHLFPHHVPLSMLYPMVAIGRDGSSERDRLRRACLATICELAFVNAQAANRCDAISCILRNILDCYHYPRINESLVVTVLYLLNHPNTRHYIKHNTDLEQLIAPFTDCHFKFSADTNEHGTTGDEQETRFKASKMALLTVMRSWPGLIRMCRPTGSGLQSLVGILYIQNTEIRHAIMDVMFELFRLTSPKFTDNFVEALNSVDPSAMREEWKLQEGFVAEEGRAILPHLANIRPNLIENHLALILAAWIETGILQALVEVITSTEGTLFTRAVVLLGELLHLANTLLPHECTTHTHCLPNLMAVASSFDIPSHHRHRATLAVSYLNRIHSLKKRGPRPCSLFLDQLLENANTTLQLDTFYTQFTQDRLSADSVRTGFNPDDFVSQVIRETHVLSTKDYSCWDWHSISALLKCPDKFKKLDDQTSQRFVRRLLHFFKPTSGQYSSIEQKHVSGRNITVACCHYIDFLIDSDVEETNKLIVDFLADINSCLSELKTDSVLSVSQLTSTLSKYYFLFIGRFSATDRGEQFLQRAGIFQSLCDLLTSTTPDVYIKLIVSSMYYARDCTTKVILSKALVSTSENGRLYSTKFLRVLLRTQMPMFRSWGMEVLVTQLYDPSNVVAMAALNLIDEACEVQTNLESLLKHRPSVLHLGERGTMLLCRFLSHQRGFTALRDTNYIDNELARWHKSFNVRYVKIVEELLNEALTTYERTYEGSFSRRTSKKCPRKDVYLPTHLYGQLTQHKQGFQLLKSQECIQEYFQCIKYQVLCTDADLILLKAALWAVGNIGLSTYGIVWLKEEGLVTEIIRLAEECGVFSVRGTAFYTLGLLASTRLGAATLAQYGWESTWRNRADKWPIVEQHEPLYHCCGGGGGVGEEEDNEEEEDDDDDDDEDDSDDGGGGG
ncbi:rapamycin-insensitive companion of mTOR-like, partial [Argonauta hians]